MSDELADDVSIDELQKAIRHTHGCESLFLEAVEVHERFNGETVWQGAVKVFDLVNHSFAKRCYAWSRPTSEQRRRFYTVLHWPPVDGPVAAVRTAIAAEAKGLL